MNLQILQTAIQGGWTTDEDYLDNLAISEELTLDFIQSGVKFNTMDDDDINEWYTSSPSTAEDHRIIRAIVQGEPEIKERIIRIYTECDGNITDIYMILEDEYGVYSSDLEKLDKDTLNMYLKYLEDDDDNRDTFQSAGDFKNFVEKKFKNEDELNEEDIKKLLNEHFELIDMEMAKSQPFMSSLDNISENKNGMYRDTWDDKVDAVNAIFEQFNYDSELLELYFDNLYGIYEDSFDDAVMMSDIKKMKIECDREDRINNRIDIDEAQEYLDSNEFSIPISVSKGHIGLEDMTFDSLTIDGELQCSSSNGRGGMSAWYTGRNFGDNTMAKDWFFELVNKYKKD